MSNNFANKSILKEPFLWLNGNHHTSSWIAVGSQDELIIEPQAVNYLSNVQAFLDKNKGNYIFGAIAFTLYDELFHLPNKNKKNQSAPVVHLMVPRSVFFKQTQQAAWELITGEKEDGLMVEEITCATSHESAEHALPNWQPEITKEEYISAVESIQKHIQRGDVYELNFCYSFESAVDKFDPFSVYHRMNSLSRASFSAFGHLGGHYLLSASPERFIQKSGSRLMSQPIKGTTKRGINEQDDQTLLQQLSADEKERRENIMIVDLVRNDLSKIAKKESVQVDELCAIYTFDTVHQMISTISCEVEEDVSFTAILSALFPMGSMTGAPKKRALELIHQYEKSPRGMYSGSIGMIRPNGDFDWNVVIRTLLYNDTAKKMTYSVGSAITYASDPEGEYEETLLKAKLAFDTFNVHQIPVA